MTNVKKSYRSVAVVLCGAMITGGSTVGCTGSAGGDAAIAGIVTGLGAGAISKAAGMSGREAVLIGTAIGGTVGAVTYFVAKAKYQREADERDRELARRRAQEVIRRDREAKVDRKQDYYVITQTRGQQVEAVKVIAATNEPVGPVIGIDQKDIEQARNNGKPVQIDGHELAGDFSRVARMNQHSRRFQ